MINKTSYTDGGDIYTEIKLSCNPRIRIMGGRYKNGLMYSVINFDNRCNRQTEIKVVVGDEGGVNVIKGTLDLLVCW